MAPRAERDLLKQIRAGRVEACAELIRTHHADVYAFLFHLARDAHVADDLTQETFAAAWENIASFEQRATIGTWLHKIAYRKFIDYQRRMRRSLAITESLKHQSPDREQFSPLDTLVDGEQSRCLIEAVHRLTDLYRTVIVLHYLQGMSFREMAAVLGEPLGTVKWRTNQALKELRTTLERVQV